MTDLAEARAIIEQGRKVVTGLAMATSQTDEPYEIFSMAGPVTEGEFFHFASAESIAVSAWLSAMQDYLRDRPGTLYWRIEPEIERFDQHIYCADHFNLELKINDPRGYIAVPVWRVYCRLLVSDKPVLYETQEDYDKARRAEQATHRAAHD